MKALEEVSISQLGIRKEVTISSINGLLEMLWESVSKQEVMAKDSVFQQQKFDELKKVVRAFHEKLTTALEECESMLQEKPDPRPAVPEGLTKFQAFALIFGNDYEDEVNPWNYRQMPRAVAEHLDDAMFYILLDMDARKNVPDAAAALRELQRLRSLILDCTP